MSTSLRVKTNELSPVCFATAAVETLQNSARSEVLEFLARRPINTAPLAGLIRDNGLESPFNRGSFYGYRNSLGQLEGVALIGHSTLIETASDLALRAFAEKAQSCESVHLIMCEENRIDKFWSFYAQSGQEMRQACRELLLELRWPFEVTRKICRLRLATPDDLAALIPVHAQMALEESGVNPWLVDPAGFTTRYERRIKQGRTWVLTEGDQLIFKADVVSETPETTYIEGVWVNPAVRRQGYGRSCMSQLARMLLWRSKSICLFVNDENEDARRFYRHAGYHLRTVYDTIFLK